MECSVGIVIRRSEYNWLGPARQKLCMIRRTKNPYYGFYEFPGGQINKNEDPFEALKRELSEELGIDKNEYILINSGDKVDNNKVHATFFTRMLHHYDKFKVILNIYLVWLPSNISISSQERRDIIFVNPIQNNKINFLDSTFRILRFFEIPRELYIAENKQHLDHWKIKMQEINSIRIRKTYNNHTEYAELVSGFIENLIKSSDQNYSSSYFPHAHNHRLLIIDDLNLYNKLPIHLKRYVGGMHYNSSDLKQLANTYRWKSDHNLQYSSCYCHSLEDLKIAEKLNMDFALLSPVLTSKDDNKRLGWEGFKSIAKSVSIPILALGGMDKSNECLNLSLDNGGYGISGISNFWEKIE